MKIAVPKSDQGIDNHGINSVFITSTILWFVTTQMGLVICGLANMLTICMTILYMSDWSSIVYPQNTIK